MWVLRFSSTNDRFGLKGFSQNGLVKNDPYVAKKELRQNGCNSFFNLGTCQFVNNTFSKVNLKSRIV